MPRIGSKRTALRIGHFINAEPFMWCNSSQIGHTDYSTISFVIFIKMDQPQHQSASKPFIQCTSTIYTVYAFKENQFIRRKGHAKHDRRRVSID